MSLLFDGTVWTAYSQLLVTTGPYDLGEPAPAFAGQDNGLCGAVVPGLLFLVTGTHTGEIPIRVVVDDSPPALGEWEEIVEVAFQPAQPETALSGWAADPSVEFILPAPSYRARWSATRMDEKQSVADEDNPARLSLTQGR